MNTHCLVCKKYTGNINPKVIKTKTNTKIMLSRCSDCKNKKPTFISQGSGLLDSLGLNTPQNRMKNALWNAFNRYNYMHLHYKKMNNVINKFLLAGDTFMPEMHLRQPQFTYSACGPFTKHKQRIQKFKETGGTNYIYKNELDKACFAHDAAYSDSKDLTKRTVADKILKNKAFDIAKDPKYDGYQRELASMVYKFLDKKSKGGGVKLISQNKQLANELNKLIIRKFEKRRVYSSIVKAFQIILKQSNRKPNKIWVDKGSEFYNV